MSVSFWGAILALPLGQFLYWWLANHERFTRELVKLLAGGVLGLFIALVAEIIVFVRHMLQLGGGGDAWIAFVTMFAFVWSWDRIADWRRAAEAKRITGAVRRYEADEVEIIPSGR